MRAMHVLMLSQTCIKKSPFEPRICDPLREVTAYKK